MLSKFVGKDIPRVGETGRRTMWITIPRLIRLFMYLSVLLVLVMFVVEFRPVSSILLNVMPNIVSRVKHPILISAERVVKLHRMHGLKPPKGDQFVAVDLKITCRFKVAYPLVRECFQLTDSEGGQYLAQSNSPLLIEQSGESGEFYMDTDEVIEGRLIFSIPEDRFAEHLRFDRAKEREKEIRAALSGEQ